MRSQLPFAVGKSVGETVTGTGSGMSYSGFKLALEAQNVEKDNARD